MWEGPSATRALYEAHKRKGERGKPKKKKKREGRV